MYLATVITGCIVPAMNDWNALAKAKMKELKITQEGLAERLGVTQGRSRIGLGPDAFTPKPGPAPGFSFLSRPSQHPKPATERAFLRLLQFLLRKVLPVMITLRNVHPSPAHTGRPKGHCSLTTPNLPQSRQLRLSDGSKTRLLSPANRPTHGSGHHADSTC